MSGFLSFVTLISAASAAVITPQKSGVTIPLTKRLPRHGGSPITADGLFQLPVAKSQRDNIIKKYTRTLSTFERNTGESHIFSKPGFSAHVSSFEPSSLTKRQAEPITDQEDELLWSGYIDIGTPAKSFLIDFDTGSADLWVPNVNCTGSGCNGHPTYNPSASSTSSLKSGTFSITYADGSTTSGPIYTDTVTVASLTATNQYFSPVTTLSDNFEDEPLDGILGLSFQPLSELAQPPYFQSLINEGVVSSSVFSFRLSKTNAELYLGGINSAKYTGSITYASVISSAYWAVTGSVAVSGTVAATNYMVIDTGTTLIYGLTADVRNFYARISGSRACTTATCGSGSTGYYLYPCSSTATISFVFNGASYTVASAAFNLGQISTGSTSCVGAIVADSSLNSFGAWIVGDVYLQNVYAIFDVGQNKIGFATGA